MTATDTAPPPPTETDPRAGYIEGLRALADRLEAHPDCPLPGPAIVHAFGAEPMAAAVRAIGGGTKSIDAYGSLNVTRELRGLKVIVVALGGVCKRVQVGEEDYEDEEVVEVRRVTKTRPVFEVRCPPSILKEVSA